MTSPLILTLDLGSGSTRAVLVNERGESVAEARMPVQWVFPQTGWAECSPALVWESVETTIREVIAKGGITAADIGGVGVTSHRESVLLWDRATGEPVYNIIEWISFQTDDIVAAWSAEGLDAEFETRTGLRNDSFFSAGKVAWILEHVEGVRERAEQGLLAAGTIDTWVIWNLTGGRVHATDTSCASRTALFNLHELRWDGELCERLHIPLSLLPEVLGSDGDFGQVDVGLLSSSPPIRSVIADQQAGMLGQACLAAGDTKHTFGTAGVLTANTGVEPLLMRGMTASVGWTVGGVTDYEAEGVVFSSGQTLQWMSNGAGLIPAGADIEALTTSVSGTNGVYVIPAFGGMCAPHWNRTVRGQIVGLGLDTQQAHIVRAAVEACVYQVIDILEVFQEHGMARSSLKVDGGGSSSDFMCQFLADMSGIEVIRPRQLERTALGCAYIVGVATGVWSSLTEATSTWRQERVFSPQMPDDEREQHLAAWHHALARGLQ